MLGIYIHIPFCRKACHYCDFHFSTNTSTQNEMVESIISEIKIKSTLMKDVAIETIYFGGGTPSLLTSHQLKAIMVALSENANIAHVAEVTLEANPEDMNAKFLDEIKSIGINRLSVGIQSFDNHELKQMNRNHDSDLSHRALKLVQEAGFTDFSIDLIYGSEWCSDEIWESNIDQALQYKPTHISCYQLTIEEKTPFGKKHQKGTLAPIDDEKATRQYAYLQRTLIDQGYLHYEISNFALPGHLAVHNTNYWKKVPYIGFGPGAHSYMNDQRKWNLPNNARYIQSIFSGVLLEDVENLTVADAHNEYIMTALRTMWGIDRELFTSDYGDDLYLQHLATIQGSWYTDKLVSTDSGIVLTDLGKNFADRIASDLFI